LGNIAEPLVPLTYQPPIEARIDFDGVVESPEAMWGVFQQLIGQIIVELHRRGHGVRNLEVRFPKSYGPTISRTILLSRPTRDAKNLFNLFRCILDAVTAPPKKSAAPQRITPAGRNVTDGFAGLHLRVVISEPLAEEQIHLLDSEQYVGQMELAHLIERLRLRLGEKTFVQPELIEAYVPEKTYRIAEPQVKVEDAPTSNGAASARPLCLLSSPIEVKAMVSPSDDRDGKPILFTHNRHVHHIVHSVGPERISGQWWEGHNKTRDYFDVESPNGKRFWIFRVMETGKWYLHGIFE
jgi:protein ImuB